MKSIRTTLFALVAVAAAGIVQAQEATPMPEYKNMSTLDRATVVAETRQALATGQLVRGNEGPQPFDVIASTRDRASVRAEGAAAARLSSAEMLRSRLVYGM